MLEVYEEHDEGAKLGDGEEGKGPNDGSKHGQTGPKQVCVRQLAEHDEQHWVQIQQLLLVKKSSLHKLDQQK